ncbi:MAG: hypothetical protein ABJL99_17665 [Aliishimia sp.]
MLLDIIDRFRSVDDAGKLRSIGDKEWQAACSQFELTLANERRPEKLEEAVLYKWSWDLPVDLKFSLLNQAKDAGCDTFEFWQDYYKYLAAHLTPSDSGFEMAFELANGKYL